MKRHITCPCIVITCAIAAAAHADNPFANAVIEYEPGFPEPSYNDSSAVLGSPTRFTGIGIFPGVVSVFNPPWSFTDVVSIAPGGRLIISFDSPIVDHPNNPFGIDLLIFGNTGFEDIAYPMGIVGGVFGNDGGIIELSDDGENWHVVPKIKADGMFPTQGYLDSGPFDETPGKVLTDFTKPVNPALTLDDFLGLDHAQVMELYNGSGGGAGVDLASVGLSEASFVRISLPKGAVGTVEIDGFAKVSPVRIGDINGDGVVDVSDLLLLLSAWGGCPSASCPADLNGDGVVDVSDLLLLFANWG